MGWSRAYEEAPAPSNPTLRSLAEEATQASFEMSPVTAGMLGIHAFDRELDDFSQASLDRHERRLRGFASRLRALSPQALSTADRMDRDVLLGGVETAILGLTELAWHRKDPNLYNSVVMAGVLDIARRAYAPAEERLDHLCDRLEKVPGLMAQARRNLTDMPAIFLHLARAQFPGSAAFLRTEVPRMFASVRDPARLRRLDEVLARVADAYGGMEVFLQEREEAAGTRGGVPYQLGESRFAALLRAQEGITDSPQALLRRGEEELRRLRERLIAAAKDLDPALTPEEALRRVGHDHGTAASLLGDVAATLRRLREAASNVVTIPDAPDPTVVETPPFLRSTTLASMDPPGPFEDVATEAYYQVTLPDPAWTPAQVEEHLRNLARPTLEIISVHEVYPGHYVQFLHLRRHGSRVARMGMSTAFIEGWAHYTEECMVEEGLDGAPPALRVSQTAEALERVGRYLTAIRMHCEGLTWQEARDEVFMRQCGMERTPAEREAMRGTEDPMYLAYTLGKLEILALRERLRAAHRLPSLKAFHDRFLSFGTPPVPLVAAAMEDDDAPDPRRDGDTT